MIKHFYNGSDERFLKEQANTMFEELSDGIYLVVKDRFGTFESDGIEVVSSIEVLKSLRHSQRTVVVHKSGASGYANFLFERVR